MKNKQKQLKIKKKQIKAIQSNKQQSISYGAYENKLLISNERKIFKDIYNKKLDKIEELNNKINYNDLDYVVVNSGDEYSFNNLDDPLTFLNNIKEGKIWIQEAKDQQQNYYSYLNTIRRGNKNASQKSTLANINILFSTRDNAIKFIEDYGSTILEAKKLAKEQERTGLNI